MNKSKKKKEVKEIKKSSDSRGIKAIIFFGIGVAILAYLYAPHERKYEHKDWNILDTRLTKYGKLIVFEKKGTEAYPPMRLLSCGKSFIGGMWMEDGSSTFVSFSLQSAMAFFNNGGKTMLQIGLGIGLVSRQMMTMFGVEKVDVVEINRDVVDIAYRFFEYSYATRIFVGEGRDLIFSNVTEEGYYDFIVHDIYSAGHISPDLLTKEVFERIKVLLSPKGVFLFNFVGFISGERSKPFRCAIKTLKSVFPYVRYFKTIPEEEVFVNSLIFASTSPLEVHIPEDLVNRNFPEGSSQWNTIHIQDYEYDVKELGDEVVITDENSSSLTFLNESVESELQEYVTSVLPPELIPLLE